MGYGRRALPCWFRSSLPASWRVCRGFTPDGTKRFLRGGRVSGGYHLIDDETRRPEILIAEGFATGASLHEETGAAVYVAFNGVNLLPVARYVRALQPTGEIIVAADNDAWTPGNPGLTKGRAAAVAIGAKLLVPDFRGLVLSGRPTDFNDLFSLQRESRRVAA
jgi:putative DNA primase/helicase